MGVGDVATVAFVIVLIILIVTVSILYLATFPEKANFDGICRKYMSVLVSNGGLTYDEREALRTELTDAGYKNVALDVTLQGTAKLGEMMNFVITATYTKTNVSLSNSSKEDMTFSFKKYVANRKVIQ